MVITSVTQDNSTNQTINVTHSTNTNTTLFYSVTDVQVSINGCSQKRTQPQVSYKANMTPNIGGDRTICAGDTLSFSTSLLYNSPITKEELFSNSSYGNNSTSFNVTPSGYWENVTGDDLNWYGESDGTGTNGTGPYCSSFW